MNPILLARLGLFSIIAAAPFASPAHGGPVPDACSGSEPGTVLTTESVQLSHLQIHRGMLDFYLWASQGADAGSRERHERTRGRSLGDLQPDRNEL